MARGIHNVVEEEAIGIKVFLLPDKTHFAQRQREELSWGRDDDGTATATRSGGAMTGRQWRQEASRAPPPPPPPPTVSLMARLLGRRRRRQPPSSFLLMLFFFLFSCSKCLYAVFTSMLIESNELWLRIWIDARKFGCGFESVHAAKIWFIFFFFWQKEILGISFFYGK